MIGSSGQRMSVLLPIQVNNLITYTYLPLADFIRGI